MAMIFPLAMFGWIPLVISALIAVYSAIAVVVNLRRRRRVPREMLVLPASLLIGVIGPLIVDTFNSRTQFSVVDHLGLASYVIIAFILGVRYLAGAGRYAES